MTAAGTPDAGTPAVGGPILVTGLDHGGKTPLRAALEAHPNLALMRRGYLWSHFDGRFGPLLEPGNLRRCLAALARHGPIAGLGIDLEEVGRAFRDGPPTYDRLFALIGEAHARQRGARRWGMQESNLERRADRLLAADPATQILHVVRDPRTWHAAVVADGARRGGVGVAAAVWERSTRLGLEHAARHPGHYRLVRYEALATDPVAVLDAVCGFIGESMAPVVREAAGHISLDRRGHDDPSPTERAYLEEVLAEPMMRLGYDGAIELRQAQRLRYRLVTRPLGRLAAMAWRATERYASAGDVLRGRPMLRKVRLHDAT